MRFSNFMSLGLASLFSQMNALNLVSTAQAGDFTKPKRRRTGATYPHSSTRQRARYARQSAAGQIKNA